LKVEDKEKQMKPKLRIIRNLYGIFDKYLSTILEEGEEFVKLPLNPMEGVTTLLAISKLQKDGFIIKDIRLKENKKNSGVFYYVVLKKVEQ
jgi:hypothetical protein